MMAVPPPTPVPPTLNPVETATPSQAGWRTALADMSPANFGAVMATGIVSIAAHLLGYDALSKALFAGNCVLYAVLWVLYIARLVLFRARFLDDLFSHVRGPAFFTAVAATGVLGSQWVVHFGSTRVGLALWGGAGVLWLLLTYTIFAALTIKQNKPTLVQCFTLIGTFRAPRKVHGKVQLAGNGAVLAKSCNAAVGLSRGSLRASCQGAICVGAWACPSPLCQRPCA